MGDLEAQENSSGQDWGQMEPMKDPLIVNGFRYATAADSTAAREELKKIAYIEGRMNYSNPEEVLAIYDKMIANKLFVTPSGFEFLSRVRAYLIEQPGIEAQRIRPIETDSLFTQRAKNEVRSAQRNPSDPEVRRELSKAKTGMRVSVILNIMLAVLVAAMFGIAMSSDSPNILNYKSVIENQYADWEENLTARETAVREKEKELGLGQTEGKNGQD